MGLKKMPKIKDKKGKKLKDPNAPKRPLSAYFIWLGEFRNRMKIENPQMVRDVKIFGVTAGEEWKKVSEEEREPFQQRHLILKANYEEAMKNYVAPKGFKGSGKKVKDPNCPKKPSTAFSCSWPTIENELSKNTRESLRHRLVRFWGKNGRFLIRFERASTKGFTRVIWSSGERTKPNMTRITDRGNRRMRLNRYSKFSKCNMCNKSNRYSKYTKYNRYTRFNNSNTCTISIEL